MRWRIYCGAEWSVMIYSNKLLVGNKIDQFLRSDYGKSKAKLMCAVDGGWWYVCSKKNKTYIMI